MRRDVAPDDLVIPLTEKDARTPSVVDDGPAPTTFGDGPLSDGFGRLLRKPWRSPHRRCWSASRPTPPSN